MAHTIIGFDSRGRHFEKYCEMHEKFLTHNNITIIVKGGGTISQLKTQIRSKIQEIKANSYARHEHSSFSIVLAAGICNMTTKISHPGGCQIIYHSSETKVQNVISDMQNFSKHFTTQGIQTKIECIPSASIMKNIEFNTAAGKLNHNILSLEEIQSQQKQLENDLVLINSHIMEINKKNNVTNIRWDRDLLRCSTKRRGNCKIPIKKMSYQHLYDGVHPDTYLQSKWYHFLCLSIQTQQHLTKTNTSDSETESEEDRSWDFKRFKN